MQDDAGRDFIAFAEGGPPLDIDVGPQNAVGADRDIGFDDAELPDADATRDGGIGGHARGGGDGGGGIDGHDRS